ncbi:MAG TPA: phosphoribosylanthranilate isomerase [Blastocatellia bacterium]|nr:phosphoribosylanthranilate isomerase [Blastocatellia bacterium]
MNRVRVKICGVRSLEEAKVALDCGADMLGFNFWPQSPRYVAPERASGIIAKLPPVFTPIGVFVNEQADRLLDIASSIGLHAAQLHGDETPEYCAAIDGLKIIKALRVGENFKLDLIKQYSVDAVLLDTGLKGSYGGTGRVFDWNVAKEATRVAPIILAGGLTVDNVADAITQVKPVAVDVCSGVESEPGRKDFDKLRRFMREVARANAIIASEID